MNEKEKMLDFVLKRIRKEKNDVHSFFIKDDKVREFVCLYLEKRGLKVIDSRHNKHIYIDLKVDLSALN